jgi:hypothetical protein
MTVLGVGDLAPLHRPKGFRGIFARAEMSN